MAQWSSRRHSATRPEGLRFENYLSHVDVKLLGGAHYIVLRREKNIPLVGGGMNGLRNAHGLALRLWKVALSQKTAKIL